MLLLACLSILMMVNIVCAQTYPLPAGYKTYTDEGKEIRFEADFDKDGKQDLIILALKGNDTKQSGVALLFLSTTYKKGKTYSPFYLDDAFQYFYDGTRFSFEEGVLRINCSGGEGKYTQTYHFKYMPKLKDMQLIRFYESASGAADGRGSLDKKVDLLTQEYEIEGMKGPINGEEFPTPYKTKEKITIQTLTFKDFDESGKSIKFLVAIAGKRKK